MWFGGLSTIENINNLTSPFGVDVPNSELFVVSNGAELRGRRVAGQTPEFFWGVP